MKCMFCPSEIDEQKSFDLEQVHVNTLRAHAAELSRWRQMTATIQDGGGQLTVFAGHVCPAETVSPGGVAIVKKEIES